MNNLMPIAGDINTVFISYARADRPHAERLAEDLKALGFGTWIDSEQLRPLAAWEREIREAIQRSSYFFVLISFASTASESYVHKEVAYAIALERQLDLKAPFVVPLRIENVLPHLGLRSRNTVELFPSWDDGIRSIRKLNLPKVSHAIKRSHLRFFVFGSTAFWAAIYAYVAISAMYARPAVVAEKVILFVMCTLATVLLGFGCGSFIMSFIRVRSRIAAFGIGATFTALAALAIYAIAATS